MLEKPLCLTTINENVNCGSFLNICLIVYKMPSHIHKFNRLEQHSSYHLVFKIWQDNNTAVIFKSFLSDCELPQYQPPQKRGEGCKRLTIFMQPCVPLGPSKLHVVVLVYY